MYCLDADGKWTWVAVAYDEWDTRLDGLEVRQFRVVLFPPGQTRVVRKCVPLAELAHAVDAAGLVQHTRATLFAMLA